MPRYYFNLYNGDATIDDEGSELSDDQAALARAVKEARALAADNVSNGHFTGRDRIEVTNEARDVVGSVRFDEAVEIRE